MDQGDSFVRKTIISWIVGLTLFAGDATAAGPDPDSAVERLAKETVSRLEWGIDKLRRALVEMFATDPVTLEASTPPFFINVSYDREDGRILIEIGRTFAALSEDRARELCTQYIARTRGMLSVDRTGGPSVGDASSLAADFFHPLAAPRVPATEFAQALDRRVMLRALVASPINGVYSICTAGLTHSPIRHLE
jgi:hypothetical protein